MKKTRNKDLQYFTFALLALSLTLYFNLSQQAYTQTNNCFNCFVSEADLSQKFYCNYNNVGYCCDETQLDSICTKNYTFCSKGANDRNISYSYCLRSTSCGSTTQNIIATYEQQNIRATGFTYSGQRPCYWKLTTNTQPSGTDSYMITVHFTFANKLRLYQGSVMGVASGQTVLETGYVYYVPAYSNSVLNTVWIVANPDNQNTYSPDILFSYQMVHASNTEAQLNIGVEPWQVGLLIAGLCVIALSVSCAIAKWVCKLGPWEPNRDFYPKEERDRHAQSKGLVNNPDYETYRDQMQSTTQFGDSQHFSSSNNQGMGNKDFSYNKKAAASSGMKKTQVIPIGE